VELVKALMRYFSYAYHGLLALFLFALAFVAVASGSHTLQLEMLPWTGAALTWWLLGGSLFGLASVVLAFRGKLRVLFLLWSVAAPLFMLRGYFFSSYRFEPGEFGTAMLLIGGSLLAVLGAWFQFRTKPEYRSKRFSAAR
jgi:hypothetical protein